MPQTIEAINHARGGRPDRRSAEQDRPAQRRRESRLLPACGAGADSFRMGWPNGRDQNQRHHRPGRRRLDRAFEHAERPHGTPGRPHRARQRHRDRVPDEGGPRRSGQGAGPRRHVAHGSDSGLRRRLRPHSHAPRRQGPKDQGSLARLAGRGERTGRVAPSGRPDVPGR